MENCNLWLEMGWRRWQRNSWGTTPQALLRQPHHVIPLSPFYYKYWIYRPRLRFYAESISPLSFSQGAPSGVTDSIATPEQDLAANAIALAAVSQTPQRNTAKRHAGLNESQSNGVSPSFLFKASSHFLHRPAPSRDILVCWRAMACPLRFLPSPLDINNPGRPLNTPEAMTSPLAAVEW